MNVGTTQQSKALS